MWTASHSGFLKLKFPCLFCRIGIFGVELLPVSTPKKTKLPREARLCLSLSKLKLAIQKSPNIQKKAKCIYILFVGLFPVRWSRIAKFSRPFDALPVPRLASSTDWWSNWILAFRHSPWFVWCVSTCLLTACYAVIWFAKCITNQLPPSFFPGNDPTTNIAHPPCQNVRGTSVFLYGKNVNFKSVGCF